MYWRQSALAFIDLRAAVDSMRAPRLFNTQGLLYMRLAQTNRSLATFFSTKMGTLQLARVRIIATACSATARFARRSGPREVDITDGDCLPPGIADDLLERSESAAQPAVSEKDPSPVTESARAHGYYSISTGMQSGAPPAVPFLTSPPVKSVLYTLFSVKKYLIHSI